MSTNTAEEKTKYNKRIEDLIEDAEIEAEIDAERKIKTKQTRLILIAATGIIIFVSLVAWKNWVKKTGAMVSPAPIAEEAKKSAPAPQIPEPKPIPFLLGDQNSPPPLGAETPAAPAGSTPVLETKPALANVASAPDASFGDNSNQPIVAEVPPLPVAVPMKKAETPPSAEKPNTSAAKNEAPIAPAKTSGKKAQAAPLKRQPPAAVKPPSAAPRAVTEKTAVSGGYWIQAGAFSIKKNADDLAKKLKNGGLTPTISAPAGNGSFIVFAGEFSSKSASEEMRLELKKAGFNPKLGKNADNLLAFTLGTFKNRLQAEALQNKLSAKGFPSSIKAPKSVQGPYIVKAGKFSSEEKARAAQEKLEKMGILKTFIAKA